MAGSIADNASACKKCKTIPAPAQLIDCTNFTIDFAEGKFLNVGLNPADHFGATVQIITPSRYVNITSDAITRIFRFIGYIIILFVFELPVKYKRITFVETETVRVYSKIYRGESVLVIKSKIQARSRVLMNIKNLIALRRLEWPVQESSVRKNMINRPMVLQQFDQMTTYFTSEMNSVADVKEMIAIIKRTRDDVISNRLPKSAQSFVSQLKIFATEQLAEQCVMLKTENNTPDIGNDADISFTGIPPFPPTSQDVLLAVDVNDEPAYFDLL